MHNAFDNYVTFINYKIFLLGHLPPQRGHFASSMRQNTLFRVVTFVYLLVSYFPEPHVTPDYSVVP